MVGVIQFCNKFAVNAFAIYITVRLLGVFFKGRLYDKRFLYAAISGNMIIMLYLDYYAPYVWVNFLISMGLVFILAACYEAQMWKKIVVTAGINLLLALSELTVALFMGIDDLSFLAKAYNGENIALFLSRIVFWIVVTMIMKFIDRNNPNKFPFKVTVMEVLVFMGLVGGLLVLCTRKQENILTESVVLFISEAIVYLVIYLQDCLLELFESREQAVLIAQEKEYYRREAAIIQQKQEQQRQFRHDLKNRFQILNEMAEHGNILELKNYLSEIETKYREQETFSNTGNLIVDSIINSKLQDAVEKKIDVTASVMLPETMEVNTDDMVVILGNLLDNAIEACERAEFPKYINLFMNYEKGCLILNVRNSFDKVINKEYGEFVTRKKDKSLHGLGIKNVKNTVGKYNGMIEFASDEKEFSVNIILYL